MTYPDWWKPIFGRFTLEAIPYHEPILIGTFADHPPKTSEMARSIRVVEPVSSSTLRRRR